MKIYEGILQVNSVEIVARDTKKIKFDVKKCSSLDNQDQNLNYLPFISGQFVSLKFSEKSWRAYSIASSSENNLIELLIRIVPNGFGSQSLDKAIIGDEFVFKGGFGDFVLSENKETSLVFCGTGTGIAPLRSMILAESREEKSRSMTLFYGGRNKEDLAYLEEIESWAKKLKIKLGFSREKDLKKLGKYGENCRIVKFLEGRSFSNKTEFYICGNGNMVKSVNEILLKLGIEKKNISQERFN